MHVATLPLADLLGEPVLAASPLSPGYEEHANDLWRVTTPSREVVVRAPRASTGDPGNPFWAGARLLFGLEPRDLTPIGPLHEHLRHDLSIPAPRVLSSGMTDGQPWLVTELLPGEALPDLTATPDALVTQLGGWLSRLHGDRSAHWGDLAGHRREPLAAFPAYLARTIKDLTRRFHPHDPAYQETQRDILARIATMPKPGHAAPIMLDIDPTQYLATGDRLTGLVDTDAIVLGPPELELVALEPLLDARTAVAFAAGYGQMPDLGPVRPIYRYLTLLMEVQGDPPLAEWMAAPHWLHERGLTT